MSMVLPTSELIERYLVGGSPSADVDDLQHRLTVNSEAADAFVEAAWFDALLQAAFTSGRLAADIELPIFPSTLHATPGLFPGGHAAGVLDCDRGDRAGAVDRLADPCVSSRTGGSTIGFSPLSPLPSPLSGRPDHRHGRLQVGEEGIRDQVDQRKVQTI